MDSRVRLRLYDIQGISRVDVSDLTLRTIGTEMYGKNFKEGSILVCWIDVGVVL